MKVVFVEQNRCLACRNCERVCSFQESGGFHIKNARIWVLADLHARTFFTLTCLQCEKPSCLNVCPANAIGRDPVTNAVVVDESNCIGCRMCVSACPFGCIHFEETQGIAIKCDLCQGTPKCVQNCMAGALCYGDINQLAERKRQKIDQNRLDLTRPQPELRRP